MQHGKDELMELKHEPVPGYRKIFYIVFIAGALYLAGVFLFGSYVTSGGVH